ncbi:hypothetical protein [Streptomyces tibetensis]|uniref:hypothetical protein n=1 Tax=Streptomyces tibetensis TaxID=2382123 RepID=UPI0033FC5ABE
MFSIYHGDRAYGYEIDETTAKIVHIPQPRPLTAVERPEGLDANGAFEERRLRLAPSLVCQELGADGKPDSVVLDHCVLTAITETTAAGGGCPADLLRLHGNPHLVEGQGDVPGLRTPDTAAQSAGTRMSMWGRSNGCEVAGRCTLR